MQKETNYELSVDLLKEKGDEPFLERNQWLHEQFSRLPYRIYNYWMGLTIVVLLPIVCYLTIQLWSIVTDLETYLQIGILLEDDVLMTLSSLFLVLGCGQMLYGVTRMKAKVVQKGFLSFQYSVITAIAVHLYTLTRDGNKFKLLPNYYTFIDWVIFALVAILPITHVILGFFVIRVFKKNHPLERKETSDGMNQASREIFEQYEVIAGEIWKYDKQLNRWPFVVYKWWLTIVIAYEIYRLDINFTVLAMMCATEVDWPTVRFETGLLLMFILSAFAAFTMESAMKTKALRDSKVSVIVLIVCIFEALAVCIFTDKENAFVTVDINYDTDGRSEMVLYLLWIAYCLAIPVISLFGAYKGYKIIKERDHYVKVSNYSDDETYL